jgi:hypothetical protein
MYSVHAAAAAPASTTRRPRNTVLSGRVHQSSIARPYALGGSGNDGVPTGVYRADVIEIITFGLRADADVEAFLAIDGRVQTEVAYQCAGLLRRTIARNDDRWLVLQIWATSEACAQGERALASSSLGRTFMSFVETSTLAVDRFGEVG